MARQERKKRQSPYQKYGKAPYLYPDWCRPGRPLPDRIKTWLRVSNYPYTAHDALPRALR